MPDFCHAYQILVNQSVVYTTSTMAAKRRQMQKPDDSNGKHSGTKQNAKHKYSSKAKVKDDDSSKRNVNGVLYKIALFSLGELN